MVCGTEGKVAQVNYDFGETCLDFPKQGNDFNFYFTLASSTVKRWKNRYQLIGGGESQGDHLFPISTFSLVVALLYQDLSLTEANRVTREFYYPLFFGMYRMNQEYVALNQKTLKQYIHGIDSFLWNFDQQFGFVKEEYEETKQNPSALDHFLQTSVYFYNNLPLLVHCDGPARHGSTERQGNDKIRALKGRPSHGVLQEMQTILPLIVDQTAVEFLIKQSVEDSHVAIMGHFILHLFLILGALVDPSQWKHWVSVEKMAVLNSEHLKNSVVRAFGGDSFAHSLFIQGRNKIGRGNYGLCVNNYI